MSIRKAGSEVYAKNISKIRKLSDRFPVSLFSSYLEQLDVSLCVILCLPKQKLLEHFMFDVQMK